MAGCLWLSISRLVEHRRVKRSAISSQQAGCLARNSVFALAPAASMGRHLQSRPAKWRGIDARHVTEHDDYQAWLKVIEHCHKRISLTSFCVTLLNGEVSSGRDRRTT